VSGPRGGHHEHPAVEVANVSKTFTSRGSSPREVIVDVSFTVDRGTTIAVVGESGAGKSTLARCIAGLEKPSTGQVLIQGAPLVLRPGRPSKVQMVFQNPGGALDSMRSVGSSIAEPLRGHSRWQRRERVRELLSLVGIDPSRASDRPGSLSGGQLQRIVIARALAASPDVLVCDEPTSALDVSVQAQILNLLLKLQAQHQFACVLITHDLSVARVLAEYILVLRHGRVLFAGKMDDLLSPPDPLHEYVDGLVRAARESQLSSASVGEVAQEPSLKRADVWNFGQDGPMAVLAPGISNSSVRKCI
jgi:ABC-type glutathione transport system ATPase component